MIHRLQAAGMRVPKPHFYFDGALVMEMIKDEYGQSAPRPGALTFDPASAEVVFEQLIREVVKMLCAGVVHGDLSEFKVLMDATGPVIIDFPQSLDAARNQSARKILIRDVENLNGFLHRLVDTNRPLDHAKEMWDLYQRSQFQPDTPLTGKFWSHRGPVNVNALM